MENNKEMQNNKEQELNLEELDQVSGGGGKSTENWNHRVLDGLIKDLKGQGMTTLGFAVEYMTTGAIKGYEINQEQYAYVMNHWHN